MITLAALARLAAEHADDLACPVAPLVVGDRTLDTDVRRAVMGVVNLSQDSSYRPSVATSHASAVRRGRVLAAQGADVVDVGAESSNVTASRVDADTQVAGLVPVVEELVEAGVPVSVETYEPTVARAGLGAGAVVLNLTGSGHDDEVFELAAGRGASVVLCHTLGEHARALDRQPGDGDPVPDLLAHFEPRVANALDRGVPSVAIDPGLGFGFKLHDPRARVRHQTTVLLASFRLRRLGVTICQSPPHGFVLWEEQYREGEAFFSFLAHLGGAGLYRTHEVPHVRTMLDVAEQLDVE